MSVVGIDFGDDSCYIAVARQGGIETLANDYSLRATPSCVAFTERNRTMGVSAKQQTNTNIKNTVFNFKNFIGKKFRDPMVQCEAGRMSYGMVEAADGGVGIKVRYQGAEKTFSPTQITAMLFTKLKLLAETALEIKVNDVVIGVPCYFDDAQRHALLAAAAAAGLNVLRLFNETAATALAYGIYKQDLPGTEEKPRNVVFVDAGYSSLQVSAVAFNKGKLRVMSTTFDDNLGGRDFDRVIADHFCGVFRQQYRVDASSNKRAYLKLLSEVEKLKKQMSANSTQLPINIECFMEDKDVSGRFCRADFEEMAGPLLERVERTLVACLADSKLSLNDVHSVEIVGGSSRVPAIKRLIEKVFDKVPSTTLNQDEAVSRGCALQCAMLSPTFKVRDFSIQDVQPFSVKLSWTDDAGNHGNMDVFPRNHQVPFSKMMSFYRRQNFSLQAEYIDREGGQENFIGNYDITNIVQDEPGRSQKIKVKVRINMNGNFVVSSATYTKKEAVDDAQTEEQEQPQAEEQKPAAADATPADASNAQEPMDTAAPAAGEKEKEGDAKKENKTRKVRTIDYPIIARSHAFSADQLNSLTEEEGGMAAADRLENDRINAKNAVEEYVYDLRSKLYEELEQYVSEQDRGTLSTNLNDTENWLYEEGEDCQKQVYIDRLESLRQKGEPIKSRRREREELPRAIESMMTSVQLAQKVCQQFREGEEKFAHLDSSEMEKVEKAVGEKIQWVETQVGAVSATSKVQDVPITCAQFKNEQIAFDNLVRPIINKPKPKPKEATPPPVDKTANPEPASEAKTESSTEQQQNGPADTGANLNQQSMDVD